MNFIEIMQSMNLSEMNIAGKVELTGVTYDVTMSLTPQQYDVTLHCDKCEVVIDSGELCIACDHEKRLGEL